MDNPDDLDARYGRTRFRTRRTAWLMSAVAVVMALATIVWIIGGGLGGTASRIATTDIAHTIIDAHSVGVTFQVSTDPGTAVSCALEALNESFAIVGWKVVAIPSSSQRTRVFTETIRTTERGNTGLIYRCWLN